MNEREQKTQTNEKVATNSSNAEIAETAKIA